MEKNANDITVNFNSKISFLMTHVCTHAWAITIYENGVQEFYAWFHFSSVSKLKVRKLTS